MPSYRFGYGGLTPFSAYHNVGGTYLLKSVSGSLIKDVQDDVNFIYLDSFGSQHLAAAIPISLPNAATDISVVISGATYDNSGTGNANFQCYTTGGVGKGAITVGTSGFLDTTSAAITTDDNGVTLTPSTFNGSYWGIRVTLAVSPGDTGIIRVNKLAVTVTWTGPDIAGNSNSGGGLKSTQIIGTTARVGVSRVGATRVGAVPDVDGLDDEGVYIWKRNTADLTPLQELYFYGISFYNLDDTFVEPTAQDSLGSNTLNANGAVSSAAGLIGGAARYVRASSQCLSILDAVQSGLNPGLRDWTVSTWIRPIDMTGNTSYHFLGKGANSNTPPEHIGYNLALNGTGNSVPSRIGLLFGAIGGTRIGGFAVFNQVITALSWWHIFAVFDRDGDMKLWINGSQITSISSGFADISHFSSSTGDCTTVAPFALGAETNTSGGFGTQFFDGDQDMTYLFGFAGGQDHATLLYNGGLGYKLSSELAPFSGQSPQAVPPNAHDNSWTVGGPQ